MCSNCNPDKKGNTTRPAGIPLGTPRQMLMDSAGLSLLSWVALLWLIEATYFAFTLEVQAPATQMVVPLRATLRLAETPEFTNHLTLRWPESGTMPQDKHRSVAGPTPT